MKKLKTLAVAGIAALAGASTLPAQAGTQYAGESAAVRVDQTTGTRIAAATETIVYSPNWVECTGVPEVTVLIDGETLVPEKEIAGTYSWTPTKAGLNTLKHQIKVNGELKDEQTATFDVPAKVTVTDVANATWVAYTNENVKLTGEQPYTVEGNASVKVVYTAKDGYVFPDGKMMLTTNFTASAAETTVTLTAEQRPVKLLRLSSVEIVDSETGVTNATATVYVNGDPVAQNADGSYFVFGDTPIKITYTVTENAIFGFCLKEKNLTLEAGISEDHAMTYEEKKPVIDAVNPAWVEGDDGREIALDTRERIVVASPNEVLPIAYSTNNWGAVDADSVQVQYASSSGEFITIVETNENGYAEWMPSSGAYDKYGLFSQWRKGNDLLAGDMDIATIYYSTYFPLSWATPAHGTLAVTNEGVAISSPTNVLGYTYLNLAATPTYTNADRYEFAGWTATTNNVAWTNIAEATTTIEMPNAETELAANFQWKSNYNARVDVKAGEIWQVFAGETYSNASNNCAMMLSGHVFGEGARFAGTKMSGAGAGCYSYGGTFAFTNVTFSGNQAANGGAMLISAATGALVRCTLAGNTAEEKGGAVYLMTAAKLLLEDSTFDSNSAAEAESGALYIEAKSVVSLRGINTFKTAKDAIWNEGDLVWDFTDHGEPLVETYANITNAGTLKIAFDSTLTNGVYTFLRLNGSSKLEGTTDFTISNGSSEKVCEIDSEDWVYVGAKRFKIAQESGAYTLKVEPGIPMALDFAQPDGGTINVSTGDYQIATGTKIYPVENVLLAFAPSNAHWQADTNTLQLVDATNKVYGLDYFSDVTLGGANFKMTETNATLSLSFTISDAYRAELFNAATNSYVATTNEIEQLRDNRLTSAETDAVLMNALSAFNIANTALAAAYKPAEADEATNTLVTALAKAESDAQATSDAKPYDLVIADDFAAIADNGKVSEDGKFTVKGVSFQTNVNAFASFTEAYAETVYVPYVTNVYAYGMKTIMSEPPQFLKWNLHLVPYTDAEGNVVESVLTVEKNLDGDQSLINIKNNLVKIAGEGTIVISKTVDEVKPTIYDAIKGEKIVVKNVGTEPKKSGGNVEINVNKDAKVETTEEGTSAIVLPGTENLDGDITITVTKENAATNDVVIAGKTEAVGMVTIKNATTNALTIAGEVNAAAIVINNTGTTEDAEGAIVAEQPIVATGDVTIDNRAHLEADVTAGGKMKITNGSVTTLVGTYAGEEISLAGSYGALSNVTFTSDGPVTMEGENILTGPFAIDAPAGAITNYGTLAWGLIASNRVAKLANFDVIAHAVGSSLMIYEDAQPEVVGDHVDCVLAENAATADGMTFFVNDRTGEPFEVVVNGDFVVRGENERIYWLKTNEANELVLTISDLRTHFVETKYTVTEGGAVKVYVWGGSPDQAVQATVTYQKNTGAYSAAYVDGKKVSFPLILSWEKGDVSTKEIVFSTTASSRIEPDRFFTLQLGSKVGEDTLEKLDVCTVTITDSWTGGGTDYVRALAWPAHGGTVSGGGTLANAKSYRTLTATTKNGSTFVGWFKAKEGNPEEIDLSAPVEPYSESNPKRIRVGYGTENEAGTYFAYFTDVLEVAGVVEPKPFDEAGQKAAGVAGVTGWDELGTYSTMVGVKFSMPVSFTDASGKGRLTISKLPSGLSLKSKTDRVTKVTTYSIEGIPTKAGTYNAQFVASNAAGKHTVTYVFEVAEIPVNAVGTFAGVVSDEADRTGVGSVSFTAGKTGALSAKVVRRLSGQRSFSVKGYDYIDETTLGVAMTNTYGEVFEATLDLTGGWYDTVLAGKAFGGTKNGTLGKNGETNGTFMVMRNAFSTSDKTAEEYKAAQQILASYLGTYKQELYSTNGVGQADEQVGTVQYRVNAQGSVYVAAKLDKKYDGAKPVSARTFTGTVAGGFVYDGENACGGAATALRSSTYLWSTEVFFDYTTRNVSGWARYIRPNAEVKTEVVDVDEAVGTPAE